MRYLPLLLLLSCSDNIPPPPCTPNPLWAPVVIWHSPAEDCLTACGRYMTGEYPAGSGTVEAVCVFDATAI